MNHLVTWHTLAPMQGLNLILARPEAQQLDPPPTPGALAAAVKSHCDLQGPDCCQHQSLDMPQPHAAATAAASAAAGGGISDGTGCASERDVKEVSRPAAPCSLGSTCSVGGGVGGGAGCCLNAPSPAGTDEGGGCQQEQEQQQMCPWGVLVGHSEGGGRKCPEAADSEVGSGATLQPGSCVDGGGSSGLDAGSSRLDVGAGSVGEGGGACSTRSDNVCCGGGGTPVCVCGMTWTLPPGRVLADCTLLWVGAPGSPLLRVLQLTTSTCRWGAGWP